MTQYTENDLIAYHLGEPCDDAGIREALEQDVALAELSQSIAITLRVFSAKPVPTPDTEKVWQQMRATLPLLQTAAKHRGGLRWAWWAVGPALGLALLLVTVTRLHGRHSMEQADRSGALQQIRLTKEPIQDPEIGQHLDRAERWLTEVNHAAQPLDTDQRTEAQGLLLRNAVYVRMAREHGDLPDAAVLERLGLVLTAAEHDPGTAEDGWHIRLEMNTNGLLLDIRILRQNHAEHAGDTL